MTLIEALFWLALAAGGCSAAVLLICVLESASMVDDEHFFPPDRGE